MDHGELQRVDPHVSGRCGVISLQGKADHRGLLMTNRVAVLAMIIGGIASESVQAQQSPMMRPSTVWDRPAPVMNTVNGNLEVVQTSSSYWLEGLIIGGAVGAIAGGVAIGGTCGNSESPSDGSCTGSTIGGVLLGAVIGAVPGVLIGGLFKKHPKAVESAQPQ